MAKRPCAPWNHACCCCGEQSGSVPHTAWPVLPPRAPRWHRVSLACSCSQWRQLHLSSGRTQSLAVHTHCAACCCQLPLTSACPPLPVCYGSQDFCFHKLLIFSLMNNNAKKLGRNACISFCTYLWILVYASLPTSKQ